MSNTETFRPVFKESVAMYRGVDNIWMSGAEYVPAEDQDKDGILFARMADGTVQTIGPVSAYFYAQKNGYTGTYEELVQLMLSSAQVGAPITNSEIDALF